MIIPLALDKFPHRITFRGHVHPPGGKLTIHGREPIDHPGPDGKFSAKLFVNITNSRIEADCLLSNIFNNYQNYMLVAVVNALRLLIDLTSFSMGTGFQIVIENVTMADGTTRDIQYANPAIIGMSTSVDREVKYTKLLKLLGPELPASLALHDLILTLTVPDHVSINCARAVEGIRNLIAGDDTKEKIAWSMLHNSLNCDEAYVMFITKLSRENRHAKRSPIAGGDLDESLRRAWNLMDRYFHLRLMGLSKLPIDEFPELKG